MRAWKSSIESNTIAGPRWRSSSGDAAAGLTIAPSGGRDAFEGRSADLSELKRHAPTGVGDGLRRADTPGFDTSTVKPGVRTQVTVAVELAERLRAKAFAE